MASRVIMPKLTDSMEEGVVVKWKKAEGDHVESGDVLAEIETDKAVMDLEAFASGTLRKILASEGSTVPSGALIGIIADQQEDIESLLKESQGVAPSEKEKAAAKAEPTPASKEKTGKDETAKRTAPSPPPLKGPLQPEAQRAPREREQKGAPAPQDTLAPVGAPVAPEMQRVVERVGVRGEDQPVSPRVRTLAREQGIDLGKVKGSGPGGRIIERDLEGATKDEQAAMAKPAGQDVPLSQMRKAVARVTTQSKAPVPHFYVTIEADMAEALQLLELSKASQSPAQPPLSLNHILIAAAAQALRRHPGLNAGFSGDTIRIFSSIDIGVAVALEDGLIVPVLRDCATKSLAQIAEAEKTLIARTRKRELSPDEYTGATFLISNLGKFDVESFIAVILPPAAAVLAVGSVREVPVVHEGRIEPGRRLKLTLSCDHRVTDGAAAAKFLQTLKQHLEHPLSLTSVGALPAEGIKDAPQKQDQRKPS